MLSYASLSLCTHTHTHTESTSAIPVSVITDFGYNESLFYSPGVSLCFTHSNYLGYTGLSYFVSSVTSDFSDFPQQLILFRKYRFWQNNRQFTTVTVCSRQEGSLVRATSTLHVLFDRRLTNFALFYARSQNYEKRLLGSSCVHVCPHGTTRLPKHGF